MIFKANGGGALQIGGEAWNLPALSFLSCGSVQSSCVLLCGGQSSSDAPLLARLPPQQSNLTSPSKTWRNLTIGLGLAVFAGRAAFIFHGTISIPVSPTQYRNCRVGPSVL